MDELTKLLKEHYNNNYNNKIYLKSLLRNRKLFKIEKFEKEYDVNNKISENAVDSIEESNLISSLTNNNSNYHLPVIDIDLECALLPSSNPNRSHLYINRPITFEKYDEILKALKNAGIIELGYYNAFKNKGYTAIRTPDTLKESFFLNSHLSTVKLEEISNFTKVGKVKDLLLKYKSSLIENFALKKALKINFQVIENLKDENKKLNEFIKELEQESSHDG